MFVVVPDSHLYAENVFECLVAVPHTSFVARRAAAYAPGELFGKAALAFLGSFSYDVHVTILQAHSLTVTPVTVTQYT